MLKQLLPPQEYYTLKAAQLTARATASKPSAAQGVTGLLNFTQRTHHAYESNWHHALCAEYLDRFVAKEIKRLMIFMPPRTGKSELVSRRLPAYIFGKDRNARIIACSYAASLASRMNRDVQRVIDSDGYRAIYPETQLFGANVRTVAQGTYLRNSDMFEIVGARGYYQSAGVGGSITGSGMDYGIIDDPLKNREQADSKVYRDKVFEWWASTFYTRAEKDAAILLTLTRWHEDDLAGRILAQDGAGWIVLRFPALCEIATKHERDPRQDGEPLWENKYNLETLNKIRATVGPYQWQSLYQQNPRAREGNLIKVEKIEIVDALPNEIRRQVRRWDLAATKSTLADYTAGARLLQAENGLIYIVNMRRGRLNPAEVNSLILNTARADGTAVEVLIEQEPGASGKMVVDQYIKLLAGYPVRADEIRGKDKVFRAKPFADQVDAGNVKMLRGEWNAALLDELAAFPNGQHDDQVDACAGAFNGLTIGGVGRWEDLAGLGHIENFKSKWS